MYCNASFSPALDVTLEELHRCFKKDNALVVNYCDQPAYG